MGKLLWQPSEERIKKSNMNRFMRSVNSRFGTSLKGYFELYDWSVENIPQFWEAVWAFVGLRASKTYDTAVEDLSVFPGTNWFPGAELNFAENLLRYRDNRTAFLFKSETREPRSISYIALYRSVAKLADALRLQGITRKDRVAAYMPNMTEIAVAMLATTSIGATWASCGAELGVQAVIDRFGQIEPKALFTVDGYLYKNKAFDILPQVKAVVEAVPSIERVIIKPYVSESPDIADIPNAVLYEEFIAGGSAAELIFEQVPFSHPLYIMFSSGTTGKPKCMVQSVGGILLNQLKELMIHCDLGRDDTMIYMTAPSWMMWNWLMAGLGVGAKIVLYDGNPGYPDLGAMWRLVEDEKITFFGTSATYINVLRDQGLVPKDNFDLSSLRSIGQTGSPLSAEGFEYVYSSIKEDVHFNSLSGGTDINGCFILGSPVLPVYAGQCQSPALGMKVKSYDENGKAVYDRQGELVCEAPAPCMPIYFFNDPDMKRYKDAYFNVYRGKWRHGDYVEFYSDTRGVTFFGRSDSVLKPSGVRIGTAEIYNIVERFKEITDSVALGQNWKGDQRVLLFVKLAEGETLTEELKVRIKTALRDKASPRHVPALILEITDIPYTFSGKKVESAFTNIINHRPVTNRDALANLGALDDFERLMPEIEKD
ncbi:MAG: acetoacetate--CoA ligase [Deltaproteobacteria bacterium]|nr:acetoacetate--CoA ligase [Deltaproteobacteria bacterium]